LHWSKPLFVDIHNHLLPSVDDGARNIGEALEMARQAVSIGTDTMVATPHRSWFLRRAAKPEVVREHVAGLQDSLNRAKIPLTVLPGVEIKMAPRVAQDLIDGEIGTLGDAGLWALVEPPFDRIPAGGLESLQRIVEAGFRVVLAHPERCSEIQNNLYFVEACADLGLAFQLTSGSLLGRFGQHAQETAFSILSHAADWPLVIASDTHDLHERSCDLLREARDVAAARIGETLAQEMVDGRPRAMITPLPNPRKNT
jgi:protein-tyrosine phosphatase